MRPLALAVAGLLVSLAVPSVAGEDLTDPFLCMSLLPPLRTASWAAPAVPGPSARQCGGGSPGVPPGLSSPDVPSLPVGVCELVCGFSGQGAGWAVAECDILGAACAGAAVFAINGCAEAEGKIAFFPASVSVCAGVATAAAGTSTVALPRGLGEMKAKVCEGTTCKPLDRRCENTRPTNVQPCSIVVIKASSGCLAGDASAAATSGATFAATPPMAGVRSGCERALLNAFQGSRVIQFSELPASIRWNLTAGMVTELDQALARAAEEAGLNDNAQAFLREMLGPVVEEFARTGPTEVVLYER